MRLFFRFLIITVTPLLLISIMSIIISKGSIDDINDFKRASYSISFFSILSLIYVYVFESKKFYQKSILNKLISTTIVVFIGILAISFIFKIFVFESKNFYTPFFQATLGVCIFLLEYLVLNFCLSFNKNRQLLFTDKITYYLKIVFLISIFESALFIMMTIDIFLQDKTVDFFITFSKPLFFIPLIINVSAFLSLKYLSIIDSFKNKSTLIIFISTFISLLFVNFFNLIRLKSAFHFNLVYVILCLFSTLLLFTIVNYRDKLNSSKMDVKILSNSISKKNVEYLQLKQQVNPHFLFNNLNTLISLIEINPKKAIAFGQHLSNTYRHFLKNQEDDFILLTDEISFIKEYLEIYKAKFENGFSFNIDINFSNNQCILSLSLQEIIDNIFKHNNLEETNPIEISIYSVTDMLYISNSIQLKNSLETTEIGLNNINNRYQLLTQRTIEVTQTLNTFQVGLPILILEQ
jgi:two-component system, LytTR family, sensor kinase